MIPHSRVKLFRHHVPRGPRKFWRYGAVIGNGDDLILDVFSIRPVGKIGKRITFPVSRREIDDKIFYGLSCLFIDEPLLIGCLQGVTQTS